MKPKPHSTPAVARQGALAGVASEGPLVLVLDDDPSIRAGVGRLFASRGFRVRPYATACEFLAAGMPDEPACLLLDNQLGDGMSGVEVHAEMRRLGWDLPTVFVTAHWNVQAVVQAMRTGADGFLTKPYDPGALLAEVESALQRAQSRWHEVVLARDTRTRVATLTPREREIVLLILDGRINKEIAAQLDISLVTVKVYRGRAMRKLGAGNAAELARLAALGGLTPVA